MSVVQVHSPPFFYAFLFSCQKIFCLKQTVDRTTEYVNVLYMSGDADLKPTRGRRWPFLALQYLLGLLALTLVGAYLLLSVFLFFKGKTILVQACDKYLSAPASVRSVRLAFPFGIVINGFEAGDVSFKKAIIKMNPLAQVFRRNSFDVIYIDKLTAAVKDDHGKISFIPFIKENSAAAAGQKDPSAGYLPPRRYDEEVRFSAKRIALKDAVITYITIKDGQEIALPLWETNLEIKDYKYPERPMFTLDLTGYLWASDWAKVRASGWIDYEHRDMDLDINIDDISYSNLVRHLPPEWDPKKTGVEDGRLYFRSRLRSQANDLSIDWAFVIQRLDLRDRKGGFASPYFKSVIDALGGDEGHAARYGNIRTRMDRPWFELKYDLDQTPSSIDIKLGENLRLLTSGVIDRIELIAADSLQEIFAGIKRLLLFKAK